MKISAKNYAESLIEAVAEKKDLKSVAANFLEILYKNKQQKDLRRILALLDEESAAKNKLLLAKIYSEKPLGADEMKEIKHKYEKKIGREIQTKNIIKPDQIAGITIEIDGMVYDHSLSGKLQNFKKALNS